MALNIDSKYLAKYNIWYISRLLTLKWTAWNRHKGEQNLCRDSSKDRVLLSKINLRKNSGVNDLVF